MKARDVAYLFALTGWAMGCRSSDGNPTGSGSGGSTGTNTPTIGQAGQNTANVGGSANGSGGTAMGGANSGNGGAVTGGANSGNGGAVTGGANSGNSGAVTGGASSGSGGTSTGGAGKGGATGSGGAAGKSGTAAGGTPNIGGAPASAGSTSVGGAAPGCGLTGAVTSVQNLTIQVAAQDRSYVLFVPTTYNASTAMPLIFAWHGLGGSGTLARLYFRIEQAAVNQAIFVYPTGLVNTSGQSAWTLTQTGVDVQLFDALLADISSKYCIDRSRVYSTGHSYGAMMTNALGCFRGNVLRGIAPVAGMPPFGNPTCTGAVAAWIAHGDNDATVNFTTGGVATRDLWIRLDGCSTITDPVAVDPSPCVAYQGCSTGHPVHWCVHQDDHNWPSFAGAGIWAFFNSLK